LKSYETEPRNKTSSGEQGSGDAHDLELEPVASAQPSKETIEEETLANTSPTAEEGNLIYIDETEEPFEESFSDEDEDEIEPPRKRRFVPPTRQQLLIWAPYWGVILLGAILRFWGLGDKPLHHDESLHAYFSMQLMHNMESWITCFDPGVTCYRYDPLLHGPFQFHFIALVYKISQLVGAPDNGINTTTVRILAATLGTVIVGLPYFLRDYLGKVGAWLACFFLAVSPSMVYFSRFAREDIYMACFTLLLVVGLARYIRSRKMRWLVIAALAFSFSYATKEATFLTVAVFGSFLAALIVWELGLRVPLRAHFSEASSFYSFIPRTAAPLGLLGFFIVAGIVAKFFFAWLKALSIYTTTNTAASDLYVQGLKDKTVAIVPWVGIILGIYVLSILGREMFGKLPLPSYERRGVAKYIEPSQQRVLDTIFTMPWTHWFFALLAGWTVFLVLFTVLFTNIRGGIGDGIWQGIYYWIQQQQVARGGQPWYYYLLLIPLYEQIGVVFGLAGLIRCLVQPTRFRLFVAYWFAGNVFLYSWAAEKMPWLMIHMTMPMMLLAAIALEPAVVTLYNFVKNRFNRTGTSAELVVANEAKRNLPALPFQPRPRVSVLAASTATFSVILAALLLVPTLHNMYEVSYIHPADGPHEMMIYVQTTTDVNIVMSKIDALDQKDYGGKHQLRIAITNDAVWPFVWYVRDYPNICLNFPDGCPTTAKSYPVIITGGDNLYTMQSQYSTHGNYLFHQYHMRSWWDEGYKPPPCVPTTSNNCADQPPYGGVGVGLWLSYGDNPPPHAQFNLGLAALHIWQWWWDRRAIGSTDGSYDMGLLIQKGLGVNP
jgi:uncharacterized protein (TIGR03663 family)